MILWRIVKPHQKVEGALSEVNMAATHVKLRVLRGELQFLEQGGYRFPIQWRPPRIFEDSPTCPKDPWSACPHGDCVLLDFVPPNHRHDAVPCRHIPLNERGESLNTLYNTATNEEIAEALRAWLLSTIAALERVTNNEPVWREENAS